MARGYGAIAIALGTLLLVAAGFVLARLRDEVDLDSVRRDLLEVIRDYIKPAYASVWLQERAR